MLSCCRKKYAKAPEHWLKAKIAEEDAVIAVSLQNFLGGCGYQAAFLGGGVEERKCARVLWAWRSIKPVLQTNGCGGAWKSKALFEWVVFSLVSISMALFFRITSGGQALVTYGRKTEINEVAARFYPLALPDRNFEIRSKYG